MFPEIATTLHYTAKVLSVYFPLHHVLKDLGLIKFITFTALSSDTSVFLTKCMTVKNIVTISTAGATALICTKSPAVLLTVAFAPLVQKSKQCKWQKK